MRIALALLASTICITPAAADRPLRLAVEAPNEAFMAPPVAGASVSSVIYLERCLGGCTVTKSNTNDARAFTSSILPGSGSFSISEFEDASGASGAVADVEWAMLVQCVQEVFSPFNVQVTDVMPETGTFHMAMVAGNPQEVGLAANVLGVAPLTG